MRRPGFVSPLSLIASSLVVLVVAGITWLAGGILFSPGQLSAQGDPGETLHGAASHADLSGDCRGCHPAPWDGDRMADRCLACHADVKTQIATNTGLHGVVSAGDDDCRQCHKDHRGAKGVLTEFRADEALHERTRFSLAQHTVQADGSPFECKACHANGYTHFDQAVCTDCHAKLDAAFMTQHAADYGSDCLGCHDGAAKLAAFDHSKSAFPLDGKHLDLACRACHSGRQQLAGLPVACDGCHAADDPHQGKLGRECGSCHTKAGWTPASFDHASTGFPLTGKHEGVPCLDCHTDRTFAAAGSACNGCHAKDDTHQGKFGTDCAGCHQATAWKDETFDHSKSAFPLDGKHAGVACLDCHAGPGFAVAGSTCDSCHAKDDAHEGRFGTDCAGCHQATAWKDVTFDHSKSAFPLDGKHTGVACLECHAGPGFAVAGSTCGACHSKDDAHKGQFGADCGGCHKTTAWKDVTFDHSKSAFPLDGKHLTVKCAQCHEKGVFKGTATACSACHKQPATHVGTFFAGTCTDCHTTAGWKPANLKNHPFPLDHGGTLSECAVCHPVNYATYTCYGCHDHTEAGTLAQHAEEGITDLRDCIKCHAGGRREGGD
jgi:hypothetical protein